MLGAGDGVEHGREDLVAVAQHVDAVALGGRDAEHAFEGPADPAGASRSPGRSRARTAVTSGPGQRQAGSAQGSAASGSDGSTFCSSWGEAAWARTASSWAATDAPKNRAIDDSRAQSSRATMPASGSVGLAEARLWRKKTPEAQGDERTTGRARRPTRRPATTRPADGGGGTTGTAGRWTPPAGRRATGQLPRSSARAAASFPVVALTVAAEGEQPEGRRPGGRRCWPPAAAPGRTSGGTAGPAPRRRGGSGPAPAGPWRWWP